MVGPKFQSKCPPKTGQGWVRFGQTDEETHTQKPSEDEAGGEPAAKSRMANIHREPEEAKHGSSLPDIEGVQPCQHLDL